jgi:hypothetical protein
MISFIDFGPKKKIESIRILGWFGCYYLWVDLCYDWGWFGD